jgi:acetyltransferase-like isoleucine patch superfamily enzyme
MQKVFGTVKRNIKAFFLLNNKIDATIGENVIWPTSFNIENHGDRDSIFIDNNNEFSMDFHIRCYKKGKVRIGTYNWWSLRTQIVCANQVDIGSYCMFGRDVYISDTNEHPLDPVERLNSTLIFWKDRVVDRYKSVENKPIIIGDNVWIGERSIILKGVTIGNNSVVAAGSVVTKSVSENTVVGGNPAKFIKNI